MNDQFFVLYKCALKGAVNEEKRATDSVYAKQESGL